MPLHPQSPEFARLATRWLDGSATAAEAALLWENIVADAACAREFAEQARFDQLLQDTLTERQDEQKIAVSARQQVVRHQRRVVWRRVAAAAAVVLATGFLSWLMLPNQNDKVAPVAEAPVAPRSLPGIKPRRTTVLVARQEAGAANGTTTYPWQKQLDDFFLTGVDMDKLPLSQALKQLEEQLRELNFASTAALAALRVRLPAGAGAQLVTFHSGSISFLKAVRAVAGLAGYDVDVGDASVALVARSNGSPYRPESRSVADLLAGMGGTADPTRNRLAELLNDSRSLGLQVTFAANGSGDATGLLATPGEYQALALLAQSRDQVLSLPPLRFYVKATTAPPGAQDRILTGAEADRARADFLLSADPQSPPAIITVPMQESAAPGATAQPGEIFASAGPAGADRIYLSLLPGMTTDPQPADKNVLSTLPGTQDPVVAFVPRSDVIQFNTQVPPTLPSIAIVTATAAGMTYADPAGAVAGQKDLGSNTSLTNTGQIFTGQAVAIGHVAALSAAKTPEALLMSNVQITIIPVPAKP